MATKKTSINDYKNRMDAPVGAVRIDPKTGKPLSTSKRKATTGSRKKK